MTIATIENIGLELGGKDAESIRPAITEYLRSFVAPEKGDGDGSMLGRYKCVNCGTALDGFLGSFQWGLAHGEGCCGTCGWPLRGCHHIKLNEDGDQLRLGGPQNPFILQYAEHCLKPEALKRLRKRQPGEREAASCLD